MGRHIEALLQDNDCVIVPGFGGFIARGVPAYYSDDECLFFPPSRAIAFNDHLTANDGLLTQRYMKEYQVSYYDAAHMVDSAVDHLRDALAIDGEATLPGVGCLHQDISCAITFDPEETSIASPALFGLDAVAIRPLNRLHQAAPMPAQPVITTSRETIDIHIQRHKLRTFASAAAAAAILILFALPTATERRANTAGMPGMPAPAFTEITGMDPHAPVNMPVICLNATVSEGTAPTDVTPIQDNVPEASEDATDNAATEMSLTAQAEPASPAESVEATEPATAAAEPAISAEPTAAAEPATVEPTAVAEAATTAEPVVLTEAAKPARTYHLIISSLPSKNGAAAVVEKYVKLGFPQTTTVEGDERVRISIESYSDKDTANQRIAELRQQEAYKNVWLLSVKN